MRLDRMQVHLIGHSSVDAFCLNPYKKEKSVFIFTLDGVQKIVNQYSFHGHFNYNFYRLMIHVSINALQTNPEI